MNNLLVIIVTFNSLKWIDKCMQSLYSSSVASDVYIIDNNSSDETVLHLKSNHQYLQLIESKQNLGFGQANNLGLNYALSNGYAYVYLLNQDAWVYNDTFKELITIQQKFPFYGVLSPIQLNDGATKLDGNFILCCPGMFLSDLYCESVKEVYDTNFVMAAHWLLTIDCVRKVGGFSPSFPHYGEDHNYLHRVQFQKLKIGIVPSAMSIHDRELRDEPKQLKMRKLYLESVAKISNVNVNLPINLIFQPAVLLKHAIRYKSVSGLVYILKLIASYPTLIANRNKSKLTSFLN
jgi:N-acetylglucosaminyl-diphospho-decaprenol L-rhamnosyltransferase